MSTALLALAIAASVIGAMCFVIATVRKRSIVDVLGLCLLIIAAIFAAIHGTLESI